MTKALVVLSGGQDSTTCLAWALDKFDEVSAITFDYGQRHKIEIECAKKIAAKTGIKLHIEKIDFFKNMGKSSLINHDEEIRGDGAGSVVADAVSLNHAGAEDAAAELPNTFVPGRNQIFLSLAAIYARVNQIDNIVTGVCQTDYSGYPDCREDFIKSLEQTTALALDHLVTIHTPLMHLDKAESVQLMVQLGRIDLLADSHTCYEGLRPACGKCPACVLRLAGFEKAGVEDPIEYR
jgi:7-cyano-7-deazaguanine synthase